MSVGLGEIASEQEEVTTELALETPVEEPQLIDEPASDEVEDATTESAESEGEEEEGISADRRELARLYGLEDAEIDAFGDNDRLDKMLGVIDRKFYQQATGQQVEQQPVRTERQQQAEEAALKLALEELDKDDPIRKSFESLQQRDTQWQAKIERLEQALGWTAQQVHAQQTQAFYDKFDGDVDQLNLPFLGQRYSPMRKQMLPLYDHLVNMGVPSKTAAERAARASFPQQFQKQNDQARATAIKAQSKKRTGATRRSTAGNPYSGPIEKNPEVIAAARKLGELRMQEALPV